MPLSLRKISLDPVLNSGRPDNPPSWNRYAYTLDNPLRYVDSNGFYEWAAKCTKGDSKCEERQQWFRDALAKLRRALSEASKNPESEEYRDLERVSEYYGEENQKTGVIVGFGEIPGGFPAASKKNHVVLDIESITNYASDWKDAGHAVNMSVESAGLLLHERSHAFDKLGWIG